MMLIHKPKLIKRMNNVRTTTIVLADDHRIVRQGLHALLKAEPDFEVVGEAGDGIEALEMVKKLNPDVVVLDLMMPGLNGLEVARQLGKQAPRTKIIILSMYDDEGFVLEALSNGASAYVLKDKGSSELIRAIREVRSGHRYLSPPLSDRAIEVYEQMTKAGTMDKYETLTTRANAKFCIFQPKDALTAKSLSGSASAFGRRKRIVQDCSTNSAFIRKPI